LKLHQCVDIGEFPYFCDVCNDTFSATNSLKVHIPVMCVKTQLA